MYAVLGDVEFELITYFDGMEAQFGMDYAEHALIGGKQSISNGWPSAIQTASPKSSSTRSSPSLPARARAHTCRCRCCVQRREVSDVETQKRAA